LRLGNEPYLLVGGTTTAATKISLSRREPAPRRYGRVLVTIPVGSAGNEPHASTMAWRTGGGDRLRSDRVFASTARSVARQFPRWSTSSARGCARARRRHQRALGAGTPPRPTAPAIAGSAGGA
jgi:hypothetical protein